MAPNTSDFWQGLTYLMAEARGFKKTDLEITAGELHRQVGGYPEPHGKHAMASASDVLHAAVARYNGRVLYEPPKGRGARLRVTLPL
jgi:hypothetical protein